MESDTPTNFDFRRDLPVRIARRYSLLFQSFSIWLLSGSTSLPWMKTTSWRKMTRQLHPATRIARCGSSPMNLSPRNLPILGSSCSASCPDTGCFPCLYLCPCHDPSLLDGRVRDGRASRTRSRVWHPSQLPFDLGSKAVFVLSLAVDLRSVSFTSGKRPEKIVKSEYSVPSQARAQLRSANSTKSLRISTASPSGTHSKLPHPSTATTGSFRVRASVSATSKTASS